MNQLYEVEIKTTVVVIAQNSGDAYSVACRNLQSIRSDQPFEVRVIKPLLGELLPVGWDGMCVPYGDGNEKTIKELT